MCVCVRACVCVCFIVLICMCEMLFITSTGADMIGKLLKMQSLGDEDETISVSTTIL